MALHARWLSGWDGTHIGRSGVSWFRSKAGPMAGVGIGQRSEVGVDSDVIDEVTNDVTEIVQQFVSFY